MSKAALRSRQMRTDRRSESAAGDDWQLSFSGRRRSDWNFTDYRRGDGHGAKKELGWRLMGLSAFSESFCVTKV